MLVAEDVATKYSPQPPPVYSYIFAHRPSWAGSAVEGAYHSSEIEFVFSTVGIHPTATSDEMALGRNMTHAWAQFAKTSSFGVPFSKSTGWERVWFDLSISTKKHWRE
eukprot:CAMPEP_0175865176 /NCGR_PEP_ID=MMETSP0107_2-20121207/33504_1 /TAXON_ID=195067 ORGANISM="Goniomonas pacifica, Strain CCMP1869" /NCGR_SAMPLE_ID=MMETSP0107_2 /ASSEMBLY_ACC=CAM_ASM_000203 /LENGTH=107 /DNA_ID=CAMNT_0017182555 /DNA_START=30 /DNA_END=350 /DNA_ORIENTATION=-